MDHSQNVTIDQPARSWRVRFSLRSLLLAITVVGAFLGWIRLRSQLMRSAPFMDLLRGTIDTIPISQEIVFAVCQLAALTLAIALLFRGSAPTLLWILVVGHGVWLTVIAIAISLSALQWNVDWIQNAFLVILFFEPTFSLIVAIVGWFQLMLRRTSGPRTLMTALVILSLMSESQAILALDSLRAAMALAFISR
jgi:hypothetical protein